MKKLIAFSLFLGLSLTQLLAGTTNNVADEHGRLWNTAYFDINLKSQGPMLDYIKYSKRASFDIKHFLDTLHKISETNITAKIHGRIVVPETITTEKVYINIGPKYLRDSSSYGKYVYYNNSKNYQNAEYFLVDTKKDKFGSRYIDYKIALNYQYPKDMSTKSLSAPTEIKFTMAPKTRGFKNKFEDARIYVFEE